MQTVVLIEEDNHGLIGVAETYADAIVFLIKGKWLDENFQVWADDYGSTKPITEDLGSTWEKQLPHWELEYFNNYFEGSFYLRIENVFKAE